MIDKIKGPFECKPGKPCGMLARVLAETEAASKGGKPTAGLTTYIQPGGGCGVAYRNRAGTRALPATSYVLTTCPWCGRCPNKPAKVAKERKA